MTDYKGTRRWYQKGRLHRTDGPAVEWYNSSRSWYQNDQLHRTDGPAVELHDGTRQWFVANQLHRINGPACEYPDGTRKWYQHGVLHRIDGPAVEWANGTRLWYCWGRLHRVYGPAVERDDGNHIRGSLFDMRYKMAPTIHEFLLHGVEDISVATHGDLIPELQRLKKMITSIIFVAILVVVICAIKRRTVKSTNMHGVC